MSPARTGAPGPARIGSLTALDSRTLRPLRLCIAATLIASVALVAYNAAVHPPLVGYDASEHFKYIEALAAGHLPQPRESTEFFSPPLPYALPALSRAMGLTDPAQVQKLAQWLNLPLSLALLLLVLRLCSRIRPGDALFQWLSLLLLATVPAYYKTFSQFRAECYVAALALLLLAELLAVVQRQTLSIPGAVWLGVLLGLGLLSRQWALFVWLGAALFGAFAAWRRPVLIRPLLLALTVGGLAALLTAGWFYWHLHQMAGSVEAFNRPLAPRLSLANQPLDFYFGLGGGKLFRSPIRPAFPNQLIPIFYSEVWGDYWCFFFVHGVDPSTGARLSGPELAALFQQPSTLAFTNASAAAVHLGRANLAGLLPSLVMLAGLLAAGWSAVRGEDDERLMLALLVLVVLSSCAGYLWFLLEVPNPGKGDTIKATYLLQIFPLLGILGAWFLLAVRQRSRASFIVALLLLAGCWGYQASGLVTRCG